MIFVLAVQFLWNETIFLSGNNHILSLSFFISIQWVTLTFDLAFCRAFRWAKP